VASIPLIAIVEDDGPLRAALVGLVRSIGYESRAFASAEDFLGYGNPDQFACIVSDIQLPGMSGLDLRQHLVSRQCLQPVILITARSDAILDQQAMTSGAVCLLRKPFPAQKLIDCIEKALKP
jgi:FixJ family two-component response regulator